MYLIKQPKSSRWYVCFRAHDNRLHRIAAFPSKPLSLVWGNKIQAIVDCRRAREPLPHALRDFVRELDPAKAAKLLKWGVIEATALPRRSLPALLAEYKEHLKNVGSSRSHVTHTIHHATFMVDKLGAVAVHDLTEPRLLKAMREMRSARTGADFSNKSDHDLRPKNADSGQSARNPRSPRQVHGLSASTVNHYLVALKSFVQWCVDNHHASENPIRTVKKLNAAAEGFKVDRRALTDLECEKLLRAARLGKPRLGLTGQDRWLLYKLALETGMRRGELKSLTVGDFDLKVGTIRVLAAYAKGKTARIVPLRKDTAGELKTLWRKRNAAERAITVPSRTAELLRVDLKRAGIRSAPGRVVDFHSLRHTFGTRIGRRASAKTTKELMGHKSIEMTMRYMHSETEEMRRAVEGAQ